MNLIWNIFRWIRNAIVWIFENLGEIVCAVLDCLGDFLDTIGDIDIDIDFD